jgi:hypothetical protein
MIKPLIIVNHLWANLKYHKVKNIQHRITMIIIIPLIIFKSQYEMMIIKINKLMNFNNNLTRIKKVTR